MSILTAGHVYDTVSRPLPIYDSVVAEHGFDPLTRRDSQRRIARRVEERIGFELSWALNKRVSSWLWLSKVNLT